MQLWHGKNRAVLLQKRDNMNGVAYAKYKEPSANGVGHQYNFQHSFWGGQYSNHGVGPTDELTIKNYIRRQDVSNVDNQRRLFN